MKKKKNHATYLCAIIWVVEILAGAHKISMPITLKLCTKPIRILHIDISPKLYQRIDMHF